MPVITLAQAEAQLALWLAADAATAGLTSAVTGGIGSIVSGGLGLLGGLFKRNNNEFKNQQKLMQSIKETL